MGWENRYSEFEEFQIRFLVEEGHTPTSASYVVGRLPGSLIKKAQKLGCPFGRLEGRTQISLSLPPETYRALSNVGNELQLTPSRLTRIILTASARRNLWADILALQREMP
jgi:hypothetical protein